MAHLCADSVCTRRSVRCALVYVLTCGPVTREPVIAHALMRPISIPAGCMYVCMYVYIYIYTYIVFPKHMWLKFVQRCRFLPT